MIDIDTVFAKYTSNMDWDQIKLAPVPNRAMSFGDGLFETMVWSGQSIRFFEWHLDRLKEGMQLLGLDPNAIVESEIIELLKTHFTDQVVRVRWTVYRAGTGKYTPESNEVEQILHITTFQAAPIYKAVTGISTTIQLYATAWANCKTLNSLPYILANQERKAQGWDEIILLDTHGNLSEAGSSNLFWRIGDRYYTPSLVCACIHGVARRAIIQKLKAMGKELIEGAFKPAVLETADQVFVSNVTGISYLQRIHDSEYSTDNQEFLQELFK